MVLISSKKYACETCIKGHRSSACKHTDRPLFEIKKKGRPVTQCEHCRELRKTKQVHVKCICELKEDSAAAPSPGGGTKKKDCTLLGTPKIPESAAFPNGLPEALEASVALQLLSEGVSSDSDHGGCSCKTTGSECHCCTPRKSAPRRRRRFSDDAQQQQQDAKSGGALTPPPQHNAFPHPIQSTHSQSSSSSSSRAPSHHILARIAELRPVLPRPSSRDLLLNTQNEFSAFLQHHPHPHPHHEHFSPYGRAHDYALHGAGSDGFYEQDAHARRSQESLHSHSTTPSFDEHRTSHSTSPVFDDPALFRTPPPSLGWPPLADDELDFRACGCGDGCACAGCSQHNPGTARSANPSASYAVCVNPATCGGACLDCTILSITDFAADAGNTSVNAAFETQSQAIDEWIRDVSAMPPASPIPPDAFGVDAQFGAPEREQQQFGAPLTRKQHPAFGEQQQAFGGGDQQAFDEQQTFGEQQQQQQPHQFAVQLEGGQPFGGWGLFDEDGRAVCAAGDGCRCPPGLCECGPPGEDAALGGGDARLVVSGERASCAFPGGASAPFFGLSPTGDAGAMGAFLTVPGASGNARSRSSSTSSELSAGRIAGLSLGEDAVEVPGPHNANPHSTSNPAAASNIIPDVAERLALYPPHPHPHPQRFPLGDHMFFY